MKLTRIRKLGRYECSATSQQVNIHKGQRVGACGDAIYYVRSGQRIVIPEAEFYREWKRIPE